LVNKQPKRSAYIVIDKERCKGCGYCVAVCPHQIIGTAGGVNQTGVIPVEINPAKTDLCIGCGACAVICPDVAITVFSGDGEETLA